MDESILTSIKASLGIADEAYTIFDAEITPLINSYLRVANQMGIGAEDYYIEDKIAKWSDFLGEFDKAYIPVKTFIYLSVKIVFDPPSSSYVLTALKEEREELRWRLIEMGRKSNA